MFRFLLKNKDIKNKAVIFDSEQSKKIRKVLRMKPGDKVEAFDNKGWKYTVELEKITNDFTVGRIVEQSLHEKSSNIVLYQALPKNLKVEYVLQKCTELGVDKIVFWESDLSQIKSNLISKEKVVRWRRIANEASEQCGRIFSPEIELDLRSLEDIAESISSESNFVLDIAGEKINDEKFSSVDFQNINFFAGPEGGFSPAEREIFDKHNFHKIKLANNVLRSETAGGAFLAQLQVLM